MLVLEIGGCARGLITPPLKIFMHFRASSNRTTIWKTKWYTKTKDGRDEIHEMHSRIKFIRPYKKWRHFRRI